MAVDDPLLGHGRQIIVRPAWLGLTEEAALEPDLPIVDPHHHLWTEQDAIGDGVEAEHRQLEPALSVLGRMAAADHAAVLVDDRAEEDGALGRVADG